jgi:ribosomal protein S12 methylthiotransferase accessory factor
MTTDLGVPGIISIVRPRQHPGIALGASCHPCPAQALEKAVIESFHTYNWLVEMRRWPQDMAPEAVRGFADHVRLYLADTQVFDASFLWSGTVRSTLFDDPAAFDTPTPAQQIAGLRTTLTDKGHQAYLVHVTPADIADLGLCAVRAVTPSLQPIWAGAGRAGLDRRRIDQFLAATGQPLDTPINVDPHPFPEGEAPWTPICAAICPPPASPRRTMT